MAHYQMLDGNGASVKAMKDARVELVSAYPITPQTTIAEKLSEEIASGRMDAYYMRVESEHSAMSAAIGAQLTGIRTGTATASVGLALMHEVINMASGCRVPIVMPVVNRSLAAPWSLWCDHQDSMAERDSGWIQLYCENVQDIYDTMLCAYRIGEDARVQLPVMVCLDGFFLSHSMQKLLIPEQDEVDAFVGPYVPKNAVLNTEDPVVIDNLTGSSDNTEMRYQMAVGFKQAETVIDEVFTEFEEKFGRHKARVEGYKTEDAETVIVMMGSMYSTAKYVVNQLRAEGKKVGAVKVTSFRPFPYKALSEVIGETKNVAVLDRTAGLGGQGTPLWTETKASLGSDKNVKGYIAGLAGRDINTETIANVFADMEKDPVYEEPVWIDCDTEGAMTMREVECYV